MPLFREDNFLIVHPGSQYTIFSFGLKDSLSPPQFKVPTVVYQDPTTKEFRAKEEEGLISIHPISKGKIDNLDAFNFFLKVILQSLISKNPIVTINEIPLLLIVSSTWSRASIEHITKYVFETLELTAFNILDISIASNFGIGSSSSSLVINVGLETTEICPVVNNQTIKFATKYIHTGGNSINEALKKSLPELNDQQIEDLKISGIFEILNNHDGVFHSFELNNTEDEGLDVAKLVAEGKDPAELKAEDGEDENKVKSKKNSELDKNYFIDSKTKEKIFVGKERFSGAEELIAAITNTVYNSLLQIPDLEKRQECYDNLILTGSTFRIPGIKDALLIKLHSELVVRPMDDENTDPLEAINSAIAAYQQAEEASDSNDSSNVTQVPTSVRLSKFPEYFPEWKQTAENESSWDVIYFLGGSIYSKQIFGANSNHGREMFIDSDIYEEQGPQGIWDVSI